MSFPYGVTGPFIIIPASCEMREAPGATAIGANQVTQVIAPSSNENGMVLHSFYTQVIQTGAPGNLAQSLVVAALTAPTSFASKLNCFPIYRTFQSEKQDAVALGGFAPVNIMSVQIPAGWGIWQLVNVVGAVLERNNMRFGVNFL
jgi:hypothetical protein